MVFVIKLNVACVAEIDTGRFPWLENLLIKLRLPVDLLILKIEISSLPGFTTISLSCTINKPPCEAKIPLVGGYLLVSTPPSPFVSKAC